MEMNLRFKRRKVYRKKDNAIEQWERRLILASSLALLVTFGKYIPHVYQVVTNGGGMVCQTKLGWRTSTGVRRLQLWNSVTVLSI